MTFPCKEAFLFFEELEMNQHWIDPILKTKGLYLDELGDEKQIAETRKKLKTLIEFYGKSEYNYVAKVFDKESQSKYVQFFIPIEIDEGQEVGYKVFIAGFKCLPREYIRITILRESRPILISRYG